MQEEDREGWHNKKSDREREREDQWRKREREINKEIKK